MEKAKNLLLDPHLRVSEIAYAVGFQSLTHFNRVFRVLTGDFTYPLSGKTEIAHYCADFDSLASAARKNARSLTKSERELIEILRLKALGLLGPHTGCNTIYTALKGFGWTGVDEPASVQFVRWCI